MKCLPWKVSKKKGECLQQIRRHLFGSNLNLSGPRESLAVIQKRRDCSSAFTGVKMWAHNDSFSIFNRRQITTVESNSWYQDDRKREINPFASIIKSWYSQLNPTFSQYNLRIIYFSTNSTNSNTFENLMNNYFERDRIPIKKHDITRTDETRWANRLIKLD